MTNPFAVNPGGVIQMPGAGDALASSLANVLAQQQLQRENAYRMQQLALQQQQQAALAQYYQGQISLQSREQGRLEGEVASKRSAAAQVGGAIQRAVTPTAPMQVSSATGVPAQPAAMGMEPGPFQQVIEGGAQAIGPNLASIISGVAPENVGAAIQGLQQVQALQPQAPALPTSAQEMEYLKRLASRDPAAAQVYWQLIGPKGPGTVINNIPAQGETEFSKELAKAQVTQLQSGEKDARNATNAFPSMDEAYKLVDRSFTGFGANQLLGLARVAGAAGFKVSKDKVADTQTMVKLLRDQTLSYLQTRALGSGTAVSDKDREFMERQSAADITLDQGSIKRIIRINVGTGIMRIKEAIDDLRDQAVAYPKNAPQLLAKADRLQRAYAVQWKRYGEMLQEENKAEEGLRQRLGSIPGVQLPAGQ